MEPSDHAWVSESPCGQRAQQQTHEKQHGVGVERIGGHGERWKEQEINKTHAEVGTC